VRGCSHVLGFLRQDLDGVLTPEQSAQFDAAIARLRQMETMLRELLDYARLGQDEPRTEAIEVVKLLEETIALLEPPAGFEIQLRAPLPGVDGAPALIALVFRNLIGNAVKHHHRATGLVVVQGERKNGRAEFFVSDDGPGIDPAMHKQIFEPFRKVDPQRAGTGMGLAFVKRALERARGSIEIIASGPGQGTTFRVTLPVRAKDGSA
jgi:signal transduction histidine kinase